MTPHKLLIANRGEIACRIARTARTLGLAVATVHSRADAEALHVREIGESVLIGEGPARQSYLDIEAVVQAALSVGAQAVHPGFGFLSENAAFAQRCADAGLLFIGPAPETLALFGDKAASKRLARALGIPVAEGLDEPSDHTDTLLTALDALPLPLILKAVAGGGGKGMRVVRERAQAREAIEAAVREGRSAFGDGRLIAERYLSRPRHVEVQILGDGAGEVIHLHDRECSLQRRHQKLIEEAPAPDLPAALRERLHAHALALGRHTRYRGLGTVEFALLGDEAVFLEVNPRLQVEHPVTEGVTGLDLVALQLRTVFDGRLPLAPHEVPAPRGVAVQARLCAEDPLQGFLPATGTVACFEAPRLAQVRTDAGVDSGGEIGPYYDPMIAKLIAWDRDRASALARLRAALAETTVQGVANNRAFLLALLGDERVQREAAHTEFIDGFLPAWQARADQAPSSAELAGAVAAQLWAGRARAAQHAGAWHDAALTAWRGHQQADALPHLLLQGGDAQWRIGWTAGAAPGSLRVRVDGAEHEVQPGTDPQRAVSVDGHRLPLRVWAEGQRLDVQIGERQWQWTLSPERATIGGGADAGRGAVRSPMMGLVASVNVHAGQRVAEGERLATLESMKMEMAITAPVQGTVRWVGVAAQDKVERHQSLFQIEAC